MNALLKELQKRGLIAQCTDLEGLSNLLDSGPQTVFCGFDATADSLTVGNLLPLAVMRLFMLAGHRAVGMIGVATAMMGDPSGRTNQRKFIPNIEIRANAAAITEQIRRILPKCVTRWNSHFFEGTISVPQFFSEIANCFSVSEMLRRDAVQARLESGGMTFGELSYMMFQAFDFWRLSQQKTDPCFVQLGGSDQWGNICSGVDLIRCKSNQKAFGLTFPLVTKPDGTKFGKSSEGAVWLDAQKTLPWDFFQFWMNQPDSVVPTLARFFLSGDFEGLIERHEKSPQEREAQRALAVEMTGFVHGKKVAEKCRQLSEAVFGNAWGELTENTFVDLAEEAGLFLTDSDEVDTVAALVDTKLASSKSDARRLIDGKGVSINGQTVDQPLMVISPLLGKFALLQKGKKEFRVIARRETWERQQTSRPAMSSS